MHDSVTRGDKEHRKRNRELIGNRELINSNVTSLWDIQVEMAAGTREGGQG